MISENVIRTATPFLTISERVSVFLEAAKLATAGGVTWQEFGELVVALLRLAIETLDTVSTLTGPEKKAIAMEAVAALFDTVADRAIPAAAWPIWFLVRPAVRSLVLALASGAVESLLPLVRAGK